jgi:hypothetical protein
MWGLVSGNGGFVVFQSMCSRSLSETCRAGTMLLELYTVISKILNSFMKASRYIPPLTLIIPSLRAQNYTFSQIPTLLRAIL